MRALRAAGAHGLVPEDYDADALERAMEALRSGHREPDAVVRVGKAITATMLRFLSDLRFGRVRPQEVEPHFRAPVKDAAFVVQLREAVADAVRRFQARHGLQTDGVLGKETLAALNVPVTKRLTQIVLSLERLRWLPRLPPGPLIAINIPSFQLWAFADASDMQRATLSMPVVVGRAMHTETPVCIGEMRFVEFSPYWNVPPGILRNELLPRLASDPSYLEREAMEVVSTRGDGRTYAAVDGTSIAALRAGEARLRQRPGVRNALGGVKLVLPNTMDIYLHATPARELFERSRRDFSHGCVREPEALAQFVLRGKPDWMPGEIKAAMTSGVNRAVALAAPVPVVIFYTTAIVDSDGRARFLADIYGHDRRLVIALGGRGHVAP